MSQRVLVTGGAGYIGSILVDQLLERDYAVFVLDDLSRGHVESVARGARFVQGNVGDRELVEALLERERIDSVVHLAAFALVLFLNRFAIALSFVALAIAAAYPYTKRFFAFPQAVLGIAFGFGIPMAYAAVQERLPLECWLLLAANVCYAFAYDTEYAMVDRDDDAKLGIRTSALTLGRWDVAAVMASYAGMLALLRVRRALLDHR